MEFVVVTQSGLTRAGARLLTVLEKAHRAALLTPEQYASSQEPSPKVGVIFLGDFPASLAIRNRARPAFDRLGVSFGHDASRAFVLGSPVADPKTVLQSLNEEISDLQDVAGVELLSVDTNAKATLKGVHLAGLYLDPYLPVPAETEVARRIDFSPARMCWERQYTYGIARFLQDTFDGFVATLK